WQPIPYSSYPWAAVVGLVLGLAIATTLTLTLGVPWAKRWWTDETAGPGEDEQGVSTKEMTLFEHLLELRNRLVISVIALALTPGATICFVIGASFAYFVLLPAALGFLIGFGDPTIRVVPTIESYVKFVSRLMIATGLIFELPLVMFFLAKLRLVNPKLLSS